MAPEAGAAADSMGLRAERLASPSRGVLQLLRLPLLLLLLLSSGARGAAAQGDTEVPTLYLWKTGKWDRVVLFSVSKSGAKIQRELGVPEGASVFPADPDYAGILRSKV